MALSGIRLDTESPDPVPKQTERRSPGRALKCLVIGHVITLLQAAVWEHDPLGLTVKEYNLKIEKGCVWTLCMHEVCEKIIEKPRWPSELTPSVNWNWYIKKRVLNIDRKGQFLLAWGCSCMDTFNYNLVLLKCLDAMHWELCSPFSHRWINNKRKPALDPWVLYFH